MLIAGGTDLVPNMKRRHQAPKTLVSLRRVEELKSISNGSGLKLGAGLSLTEIVDSAKVRAQLHRALSGRRAGRHACTCATWARSAATCASTPAAPTSTRTTSGERPSTSA